MPLTRRSFLVGAGALLGLAACGSPAKSETGTAFTYTDARGKKVDLASRPIRVVAQSSAAASLWDLGYRVAGVYGELRTTDGRLDYQAGSLDLSKVTVIGKTYGEFNVEQYASVRPQLLVDLTFDNKRLWYVSADVAKQIDPLAPTIGMRMQGLDLPGIIDEFVALAGKLGADPAAASTTRADFEAAAGSIKTVAATRADIRVLAVSRDRDKVYLADPGQHPDLRHWSTLGVRFVGPTEAPGTYFAEASWEKVGSYPADVIVYDVRETPDMPGVVATIPTWTGLPAVKAGQVYPWRPAAPYSYRTYAPLYRDVAAWLGKASRQTS
jgi:iron complex transport system substrate-binding protein